MSKQLKRIYLWSYSLMLAIFWLPADLIVSHKLVLFSLFIVFSFLINGKRKISFVSYDIFLLFCFASMIWTQFAPVSYFGLAIVVFHSLWIKISRSTLELFDHTLVFLHYSRICTVALLCMIVIYFFREVVGINISVAKNHNYNLLLCTFMTIPFIFKYFGDRFLCYIFLIVIGVLAMFFNSAGVVLSILFLIVLCESFVSVKRGFILIIVFCTPILFFLHSNGISSQVSHLDRLFDIKKSLKLWMQNPIFGSGLDTWIYMDALSTSASNISHYDLRPVDNHNYPTKILVELGGLGLFIYFYFIYDVVRIFLKKNRNNVLLRSSITNFLLYVFTINFYYSSRINETFISGIELLAFSSIGIILGLKEISSNE